MCKLTDFFKVKRDALDEAGIPKNRKEVYAVFGDPDIAVFKKRNMVLARGLRGNKEKLYCHKLAEPRIRAVLDALSEPDLDYIVTMGCYNHRHQRHDPTRPLSYHSWGIAIDINPADNRVIRYRDGMRPKPFSPLWLKDYPNGVSKEIVSAFKAQGFTWGGDWKNFCDPMHFQLKE